LVGFGGAFTQSSATVYQQLPPELQGEFLEAYFSNDTGIGYSTGRLPINSCDFSPTMYSFDDVAGDFELEHFDDSVAQDAALSIPFILAALKLRPDLKLFGSPWSPPAWMKTNNDMLNGGSLKPEAAGAWSQYFLRWIAAYEAQGVPIWGVTVQNEPMASQAWESCTYTSAEQAAFVANHLGPALRDSAFPNVKLFGFDHNKAELEEWADALLGPESAAASFVGGLAFHWYSGSCFGKVAAVSAAHPDKLLLPSEACYELTQMNDDAAEDTWLEEGNWARGEGKSIFFYQIHCLGEMKEFCFVFTAQK
jgi:glucosylceramidase